MKIPIIVITALLLSVLVHGDGPISQTQCGPVEGTFEPNGVSLFRGIPYVAPAVGQARWTRTQIVTGDRCWNGTLPAKKWGNMCPQFDWEDSTQILGDEDCSFINVFAPPNAQKLPVLVFIHGGSSTAGSGNYNMSGLAERTNSVVVTFNYRLGIMGFFAAQELTETSHIWGTAGNWGFCDVLSAIFWVNFNIDGFGGDKDSVVLFGQSTGGTLGLAAAVSPYTSGLVKSVVAMSPSVWMDAPAAEVEDQNVGFINVTGCHNYTTPDAVMSCLRDLSMEDTFKAVPWNTYPFWSQPTQMSVPKSDDFQLNLEFPDGDMIPASIRRHFNTGDRPKLNIVIGNVADEGTLFNPEEPIETIDECKTFLKKNFDDIYYAGAGDELLPRLKDQFDEDKTGWLAYQRVVTDLRMVCASRIILQEGSAQSISKDYPVYAYLATGVPHAPGVKNMVPGTPNFVYAFHAWDLLTLLQTSFWDPDYQFDDKDRAMGDALAADLVSFAKNGKPANEEWAPFTKENPVYRNYNGDSSAPMTELDPRSDVCDWYEAHGAGWKFAVKN